MTKLKTHTMDSAPEASKALFKNSLKAFGMIPNLHAVLASAPATLEAYQKIHELFSNSSFDAEELTVVWQSINVEHECGYCVPAHTGIAHSMKVSEDIINALLNKTPLPSAKLEVLRDTTLSIVRNRGRISSSEVDRFFSAGYGDQQLLEIILGIAQKVISNYTNHIAETELDDAFKRFA